MDGIHSSCCTPTLQSTALPCAGEENLSVIVAPIGQSFRLQDLGDARGAAQRFLSTTIAPEGSDKEALLLGASDRCTLAS